MIIRQMNQQMLDELKEKALKLLETEDIDTVAATLRIRKADLKRIIGEGLAPADPAARSDKETTAPEEKVTRYSREFKAAALAMMEEKGAVATIKALGISSYTLYNWKHKAMGEHYPRSQGPLTGKTRRRYTPEFKAEVIEYYQSHGLGETRQKYGISGNAIYTWLEEKGIDRVGKRPVDHSDAIALYREKGPKAVLEAYGISRPTLRDWLKNAGIDTHTPKYSPEIVEMALAMAQKSTLTDAAKKLGIPITTLCTWKKGKRRKD